MARSRLTVTLPVELRRRAEARAAREGTTLSAVVRERLEEFAEGVDLAEEQEDVRVSDGIAARVARGEEPLDGWEDVKARLDALPG